MAGRSSNTVKVTFTGDTSDLEKKLDKLEREVAKTSGEIDIATESTKKSKKSMKDLGDSANDAGDRLYAVSDAITGVGLIAHGWNTGSGLEMAIGLAEMGRAVSVLGGDFLDWGRKAWEASGDVVKAHAASVIAKGKDIAAMVAHKAATIASTIATQAWAAAQWLLNVAMEASPILLAVAAIALLVAGVIYAYQHFDWFHDAVDKVWHIIQDTFNWIQEHWQLLTALLTGPFALAIIPIVKNFDTIREAFADVYGFFVMIKDKIYNAIKGPFEDAFNFVKGVYDKTISPIITALKDIKGAFGGSVEEERANEKQRRIDAATAGMTPEEKERFIASTITAGFATGGVVPGPVGAPMAAIVHGGETVLPTHTGDIVIMIGSREFARIAADELRRQMAGAR